MPVPPKNTTYRSLNSSSLQGRAWARHAHNKKGRCKHNRHNPTRTDRQTDKQTCPHTQNHVCTSTVTHTHTNTLVLFVPSWTARTAALLVNQQAHPRWWPRFGPPAQGACICVYVFGHACACGCVCACGSKYVCMHVCACGCERVGVCACSCVCVCVYSCGSKQDTAHMKQALKEYKVEGRYNNSKQTRYSTKRELKHPPFPSPPNTYAQNKLSTPSSAPSPSTQTHSPEAEQRAGCIGCRQHFAFGVQGKHQPPLVQALLPAGGIHVHNVLHCILHLCFDEIVKYVVCVRVCTRVCASESVCVHVRVCPCQCEETQKSDLRPVRGLEAPAPQQKHD